MEKRQILIRSDVHRWGSRTSVSIGSRTKYLSTKGLMCNMIVLSKLPPKLRMVKSWVCPGRLPPRAMIEMFAKMF